MKVITRFAPSPTGFLHIGSARTALFNYLFAKRHNGEFLLRIEDTDYDRLNIAATKAILSSLKWLNLDWDKNVVYQSQLIERHREIAHKLVELGKAYYCFCSKEEIEKFHEQNVKTKKVEVFRSPWRERNDTDSSKPCVIRFKTPTTRETIIHDLVQGDVTIKHETIEDFVILRSDGTPPYMLAVVVDDHDMKISHIIRGDDHLTNTAKQILIYNALEWQLPKFAHIPLIHGPDGTKLSKRHGAIGVESYKDMGYLPESICNYLSRLGWSHGNDEIISREDAIKWFDIEGLGKGAARIDFDKMKNLNSHYIKTSSDERLTDLVIEHLKKIDITVSDKEKQIVLTGMKGLKLRASLINDLAINSKMYLVDHTLEYTQEALDIIQNADKNLIKDIISLVENLDDFSHENIQTKFKEYTKVKNMKTADIMKPIRALLSGVTISQGVFEIIDSLGKEYTISRLKYAL